MVQQSPFPYQGPVAPSVLRGRDDLLADLTRRITERRVTALLGPRRYGKTSVLDRLAYDLAEVATVSVDLYGVQSIADAVTRFDDALANSPGPFKDETSAISAKVGIHLGAVRAEFARPRRNQPDPTARLSQLLDVFLDVAARVPTLLVLDEFSDIGNAPGTAALLRTKFQRNYHRFGLLFAGSHVSTMRELFADHEQPFYGQADLVTIGALDATTVEEIIRDGFSTTGRSPGTVAGRIHQLAEGHPQRTMLLADAAWRHTPVGGDGDDGWGHALSSARRSLDPIMRFFYDHLTSGERRTLRLVAHEEPLHGAAASRLRLTAGSTTHAYRQLIVRGHLHDDGTFTDPLFADWFRHTLPLT